MRVDELITAVRLAGRLNSGDADFTDARIRQELTDAQHAVFGHAIVQARAGAWLKVQETTTTAGRVRYRLPYRACAGIGESIEIDDASGRAYEIHGDQLVFESAPTAGSTLSFLYYLRPSLLVQEQTAAGQVASIDTDAPSVTVTTALPVNRVTAATIASGDRVDIMHENGWHELSLVNATCTISSLTLTFPTGTDLTDVEEGDWVRAAGQTDWPCLPDDFHDPLATVTAARISRAKGNFARAKELELEFYGADGEGGDLGRFRDILVPRIKDSRDICVPRLGIFRGSRIPFLTGDT